MASRAASTTGQLDLTSAARLPATDVLRTLGSSSDGLTGADAAGRLERVGANALHTHGVRAVAVFASQLRNPLLILLLGTAVVSAFVGERTDALIIFLISRPQRRPGVRQRVPLGARGRGAALAAPAHVAGAARRRGRGRRRDRARARRRRAARRRRRRAGRPAAARGERARVRRVGADRRVAAGGEERRAGRQPELAARPPVVRVHGHGRAARAAASGSSCRPAARTEFGRIAARLGDAPAADGIPARPARLLAAARARHRRCSPGRSSWSTSLLGRSAIESLLFALVDRGRPDAAAAAGDRHRQPLDRRAAAGASAR